MSTPPYPVINDEASHGPLSGILCALNWGTKNGHSHIVTLPCDTPFISAQWLIYLHQQLKVGTSEAVISRYQQDIHPLCGIWSSDLATNLRAFMENNQKKAVYRWANHHAAPIDYSPFNKGEENTIDPFMNLNTLQEYKRALRLHEGLNVPSAQ